MSDSVHSYNSGLAVGLRRAKEWEENAGKWQAYAKGLDDQIADLKKQADEMRTRLNAQHERILDLENDLATKQIQVVDLSAQLQKKDTQLAVAKAVSTARSSVIQACRREAESCENGGHHHLFQQKIDANGQPMVFPDNSPYTHLNELFAEESDKALRNHGIEDTAKYIAQPKA